MNALELATELEACFTKADWNVLEAAAVLRKQQQIIEKLEEEVKLWQTQAVQYRAELGFKWTGEIRQWSQK